MALILTADTCPTCWTDHTQPRGDTPICPEHGHAMKERRVTDAGIEYRCPVQKCPHTQTLRERPTMTTEQATSAALAIRPGQDSWTPQQLSALRQIGAEDAPQGDLEVFFHYCQATGLDPFAKQIRLRKDRQKGSDGQWQARWSIETEIDGYRVIAHRAAKRDGVTLSYGPPLWYDRAGAEHRIWLGAEPPAGASRTVYKDGAPFPAVIRFNSFAKYTKDGQLMAMWAVMPDHLIAKCAEAQALRMAFPHDLNDIRISDEAEHVAPAAPDPWLAVDLNTRVTPAPHRPETRRSRSNREAVRAAISQEFGRIGLEDPEERGVYVNKLNNKPADAPLAELTDRELSVALEVLRDKETVPDFAALVELCSPEPAPEAS